MANDGSDDHHDLRSVALEAGVEPDWRMIKAEDAEAFIWGANVKRRQMNKGQIAMIAAVSLVRANHSDPDKQQEQSIRRAAKVTGIPHPTLVKALAVKRYAPDLA